MEYSDGELKRWWDGLPGIARRELVEKIRERASSQTMLDLATRVADQLKAGVNPHVTDLVRMRKWA